MIPRLDLTKEIVPAVGLGGFEVGRPLLDYVELLRTDQSVICMRTHPFWQVVYRIPQLFEPTTSELHEAFDAFEEWQEKQKAGGAPDLGEVIDPLTPPDETPAIDLWVDVRDGIIDAVAALGGYQAGFRSIRVGMTYAEALRAEPELATVSGFLDEVEFEGVDGLVLVFEPPDIHEGEEHIPVLQSITVFDPSRSEHGGLKHF